MYLLIDVGHQPSHLWVFVKENMFFPVPEAKNSAVIELS